MKAEHFVQIFVPDLDAADSGSVATGYCIAPGLVLTTGHVLKSRDEKRPIEIRWPNLSATSDGHADPREWQGTLETVAVVWDGSAFELDAAVLKCPVPATVTGATILSTVAPPASSAWASSGFPRAGKRGDERKQIGMQGSTYLSGAGAHEFEVDVSSPPEKVEDWKGASGAPVFCEGRIFGVIKTVPSGFKGGRMWVTAMSALLRQNGFRQAVRFESWEETRLKRVSMTRAMLDEHKAAAHWLAQHLRSVSGWSGEGHDALSARLVDATLPELLEVGGEALESLRAQKDPGADQVATLMFRLIPHSLDSAWVTPDRNAGEVTFLELPVFTDTMAEIAMARLDGRAATFCEPSGDGRQWPRGKFQVPHAPEVGIDAGAQRSSLELAQHVAAKYGTGSASGLAKRIYEYLVGVEVSANAPMAGVGARALVTAASKLLDKAARRSTNRHRYFVFARFKADADPNERGAFETMARQMKLDFPSLVFVVSTAGDDQFVDEETGVIAPLRTLLSRRNGS